MMTADVRYQLVLHDNQLQNTTHSTWEEAAANAVRAGVARWTSPHTLEVDELKASIKAVREGP